jgi:MerR HTH family regulatory protein
MTNRVFTTQEALALLADRGHDTTARVLRNIEDKLDLHVQRVGGTGADDDEQGPRLYTVADLDLLERVLVLQKAGLHLIEIRAILIEHDHYVLEFHANSLRRALDLLSTIQNEWRITAA